MQKYTKRRNTPIARFRLSTTSKVAKNADEVLNQPGFDARRLALRVLRALTSFVTAVLFTFDFAWIAGEHSALA